MFRFALRKLILLAVALVTSFISSSNALAQPPLAKTDITAPLVYEGTMLVLVSDDGVAAVVFRPTVRGSAAYDFRFEGKNGEKLEATNKPLFESRNPGGNLGGELFIKAGPISIGWSKGGESNGWIYYTPEKVKVHLADARNFTDRVEPAGEGIVRAIPKLSLQRFLPPQVNP